MGQKFLIARCGNGSKYHLFLEGLSLCGHNGCAGSGSMADEGMVYRLIDPGREHKGLPYCANCVKAFLSGYAAQGMVEVQRQEAVTP